MGVELEVGVEVADDVLLVGVAGSEVEVVEFALLPTTPPTMAPIMTIAATPTRIKKVIRFKPHILRSGFFPSPPTEYIVRPSSFGA